MDVLYLDYNATTPVAFEVQEAIASALKNEWGNPSSPYDAGKKAKLLIENSRSEVAQMIGATSNEIIFTSGGTEANNLVIHSVVQQYYLKTAKDNNNENSKAHVITTNIEHDSVRLPLEKLLKDKQIEVSFLPVSKLTGQVDVDDIINAIKANTCLITVMLANNETGIIQPVVDIGARLKMYNKFKPHSFKTRIFFHTDAAQAIGKIEIDVDNLLVDYLTIVGHKFYGPRIGALYFKHHTVGALTPIHPMLLGGGQEHNRRPGTENTCMIAGLGKAAELVYKNIVFYNLQMMHMRKYLVKSLKAAFGDKVVLYDPKGDIERLPNTVSVAFAYDNITGADILASTTLCASTGAACHKSGKPSKILTHCGVSDYLAARTLRLSIGRETNTKVIDKAIQELKRVITELSSK